MTLGKSSNHEVGVGGGGAEGHLSECSILAELGGSC